MPTPSDHQTLPAPDTNIEPLVMFDEDALVWIVTCPTDACPKVFADVRLSAAMRRYEAHRDLPTFRPVSSRHVMADDLAV